MCRGGGMGDSKSAVSDNVRVQVPFPAPIQLTKQRNKELCRV